jgi:tRNA threonylcarbamoyladenosine biosynthesis protein TsaE
MSLTLTGEFITNSAEETFELAYKIGESLTHSAVFFLEGDLGAGKTVFAKGIAAGLEIDPAEVNSPTFTIVNQHEGRMRLYHLDLYRVGGSAEEIRELGVEEMLNERDAIVVIEWPDRLGAISAPNVHRVKISDLGGESRALSVVFYP